MMRLIGLLVLLAACAPQGTSYTSAPQPQPKLVTYAISPVQQSLQGPVGVYDWATKQWSGILPMAVLVTLDGKPVDGVTVDFQSLDPTSGPWELGTETSGNQSWTFSGPGTGIAAVDCVPASTLPVQVSAQVIPTQGSYAGSPATSNVVIFTVTGQ